MRLQGTPGFGKKLLLSKPTICYRFCTQPEKKFLISENKGYTNGFKFSQTIVLTISVYLSLQLKSVSILTSARIFPCSSNTSVCPNFRINQKKIAHRVPILTFFTEKKSWAAFSILWSENGTTRQYVNFHQNYCPNTEKSCYFQDNFDGVYHTLLLCRLSTGIRVKCYLIFFRVIERVKIFQFFWGGMGFRGTT